MKIRHMRYIRAVSTNGLKDPVSFEGEKQYTQETTLGLVCCLSTRESSQHSKE